MSSPPLRVFLTPEQDRTLLELKQAKTIPQSTKNRAEVLRLSARGWKVEKIAVYLQWTPARVRTTIHRWHERGLVGLWDRPRPGRKPKWTEGDLEYIRTTLEQEQRCYNSRQLCEKLAQERQVDLSRRHLRRILKKKEIIWKRTRISHKRKQDPRAREFGQAELEMLQWAAAAGEICLKYLDESGFSLWSEVSYTWYFRGKQKRLEQTRRKGKRISICGLIEPEKNFTYGLALKGFKSHSYIKLMEECARKAKALFQETGQITVVVQAHSPIHKSLAVKERIPVWESQGLYIFWLPKYCSEMNLIESEWLRLKADEIAGRMFEDEYDLAQAVMQATEERMTRNGCLVERFRFSSHKSSPVQLS